ncbi:MAG TPA: SMR family transporter [Pseudothermotoga sp.]
MKQTIILIIAIVTNALANIFVKMGALSFENKRFSQILFYYLRNVYIWIGLFCFGVAFVFYSIVLSKTKLSVAYPIMTSAGFLIVSIFSNILFKESFSVYKIAGIAIIAIGIWMVSTL